MSFTSFISLTLLLFPPSQLLPLRLRKLRMAIKSAHPSLTPLPPLLRLPTELAQQIYAYVIALDLQSLRCLWVCRQLYHEVAPLFYAQHVPLIHCWGADMGCAGDVLGGNHKLRRLRMGRDKVMRSLGRPAPTDLSWRIRDEQTRLQSHKLQGHFQALRSLDHSLLQQIKRVRLHGLKLRVALDGGVDSISLDSISASSSASSLTEDGSASVKYQGAVWQFMRTQMPALEGFEYVHIMDDTSSAAAEVELEELLSQTTNPPCIKLTIAIMLPFNYTSRRTINQRFVHDFLAQAIAPAVAVIPAVAADGPRSITDRMPLLHKPKTHVKEIEYWVTDRLAAGLRYDDGSEDSGWLDRQGFETAWNSMRGLGFSRPATREFRVLEVETGRSKLVVGDEFSWEWSGEWT